MIYYDRGKANEESENRCKEGKKLRKVFDKTAHMFNVRCVPDPISAPDPFCIGAAVTNGSDSFLNSGNSMV